MDKSAPDMDLVKDDDKASFITLAHRLVIVLAVIFFGTLLISPLFKQTLPQANGAGEVAIFGVDNSGASALLPIPEPQLTGKSVQSAKLGERLYLEKRLSPKNISCSYCHDISRYGTLPQALSPDVPNGFDQLNVPTTLNTTLNASLGWLGQSSSLESQLDEGLNNPKHMGTSWPFIIQQLRSDADYVAAFNDVYGQLPTKKTVSTAISDYHFSLTTPDSPFDRFLRGDESAISSTVKTGYRLFSKLGCIVCHQGVNVGGNLYAKYGLFKDPFLTKERLLDIDMGRFLITKDEEDKHVFRVPSLRNVAMTAPYLHDGSVAKLDAMVSLMGRYQLGMELSEDDVEYIVAFLHSLTAPLPQVGKHE